MRRTLALIVLAAALSGAQVQAAELTVYTGGSMLEALKAAGADFTKSTGDTLTFVSGTTGVLQQRLRAGEHADVVVISVEGLAALQAEGLTDPAKPTPLANAVLGVAVKAGAAKPNISTVDQFKAAMLAARSVVYPDPALGATSGVYLKALFEQLGIAQAMAAKSSFRPIGALAAQDVADGKAELVVTYVSEMTANRGVDIVGLLPAPILHPSAYAAAVSAKAADPAAARAFITFVTSAKEAGRLTAAGVQPVRP